MKRDGIKIFSWLTGARTPNGPEWPEIYEVLFVLTTATPLPSKLFNQSKNQLTSSWIELELILQSDSDGSAGTAAEGDTFDFAFGTAKRCHERSTLI